MKLLFSVIIRFPISETRRLADTSVGIFKCYFLFCGQRITVAKINWRPYYYDVVRSGCSVLIRGCEEFPCEVFPLEVASMFLRLAVKSHN